MNAIKVGKYMTAEPLGTEPHETYVVRSVHKSTLGYVEWYSKWNCYIFEPECGAVLSHDCCADMARLLKDCDRATNIALRADLQCLDIHTL